MKDILAILNFEPYFWRGKSESGGTVNYYVEQIAIYVHVPK